MTHVALSQSRSELPHGDPPRSCVWSRAAKLLAECSDLDLMVHRHRLDIRGTEVWDEAATLVLYGRFQGRSGPAGGGIGSTHWPGRVIIVAPA